MTTTPAALARQLGELTFASGWAEGVVNELAAIARLVEFPPGAILFSQGSHNPDLYLICSGRVVLDMHVPARGAVRILTVGRGELLAWSALIGDGHMTARAIALDPVHVIAINGNLLSSLCESRPDIGFHVMRQLSWSLAHRLTATRLQLLDLFTHQTPHVLPSTDEVR